MICKILFVKKPQNIYLKLLFHHQFFAVPCYNDNLYLSPFMITVHQMILFVDLECSKIYVDDMLCSIRYSVPNV